MSYTKIVKLASGNVQLQDASDNPIKTLQPAANLELLPNNKGVRVMQWQGESTDILLSEIDFTRIDPAADVAFSGDAQDLMKLLGDSFFFELVSGGGVSSVEQYANLAAFPVLGEADIIYIAEDTDLLYRWDGGAFVLVGGSGTSVSDIKTGSSYSFKMIDAKSNRPIALDLLVASKIYIPFDNFTLSTLYLRYAAAVFGAAVLGIYTIGTDGEPDELLVQTGTEYDTSVTSSQGIAITPTILQKGYYAIVYHSNVTNSISAFSNASTFPNWGATSTILSNNVYSTITAALAYTGILPLVFPVGTLSVSVAAPYIIFQQ